MGSKERKATTTTEISRGPWDMPTVSSAAITHRNTFLNRNRALNRGRTANRARTRTSLSLHTLLNRRNLRRLSNALSLNGASHPLFTQSTNTTTDDQYVSQVTSTAPSALQAIFENLRRRELRSRSRQRASRYAAVLRSFLENLRPEMRDQISGLNNSTSTNVDLRQFDSATLSTREDGPRQEVTWISLPQNLIPANSFGIRRIWYRIRMQNSDDIQEENNTEEEYAEPEGINITSDD